MTWGYVGQTNIPEIDLLHVFPKKKRPSQRFLQNIYYVENNPNPNSNPNPIPDRGTIFLGGNCPDTIL